MERTHLVALAYVTLRGRHNRACQPLVPVSVAGSHRLDISRAYLTLIDDKRSPDDGRMGNRNAVLDDGEVAAAERLIPQGVREPAIKSTIEQRSDPDSLVVCELNGLRNLAHGLMFVEDTGLRAIARLARVGRMRRVGAIIVTP